SIGLYLKTPAERQALLENMTLAFWRNSLEYAALVEMKVRTVGTQASDATTTLNPPDALVSRVETSQGQNLVYGISKNGKIIVIGSDRIVLPKELVSHRVLMRSDRNASATIGTSDGQVSLMLTQGTENRVLREAEVRIGVLQPFEAKENGGPLKA